MAVDNRQRPIRLLRIITRLNVGGPAVHTILLTQKLRSQGYDTQLITGQTEPGEWDLRPLAYEHDVQPIVVEELQRPVQPLRDLVALWKIWRVIRKFRPDIVCTHTAKAGTVGRLAAWLAGVPIRTHTFHGHVFHSYFSTWQTQCFILIERSLAYLSSCIFSVCDTQAKELTERFRITSADHIKTINPGINLEPFLQADRHRGLLRKELGVHEDTALVGLAGRLVPVKNHWMFFQVAQLINGRLGSSEPKVLFLVIGDGELREELEQRVQLWKLGSCVRFLGWRDHLERLFADLDLSVLTSLNEGLPMALVESMAAGLASVATDVGGTRDIVHHGKTGLLVQTGDAAVMSQSILFLLQNPDRRREMGEAGREFVRDHFITDRVLKDYDRHYRQLLQKHSPTTLKGTHL